MGKKTSPLLPATAELLVQFGDRLRLARLRRKLSAKQVAERAGMSPMTLRSLEHGGAGVTMGAYLAVMQVLGIEKDLGMLGKADPMGRDLQDARLPAQTRATQAPPPASVRRPAPEVARLDARKETRKPRKPVEGARDWIKKGGFADSAALAGLIEPVASPKKKVR